MTNFEIKTLKDISFSKLYETSMLGFNDYDINVEITEDELIKLFKSYGYNEELSLGVFIKNKLIGFSFNGINSENNSAYNAGIAILPGFREQGLGKTLLNASKDVLRNHGLNQYILECMQENDLANYFYSNNGFNLKRKLSCRAISVKKILNLKEKALNNIILENDDYKILTKINEHSESQQSWQYSDFAILNIKEYYRFIKACDSNRNLIGIIVFDPTLGAIAKLIVHKRYRRQGIATKLLKEAAKEIKAKEITFINTDKNNSSLEAFLKKSGFKLFTTQYEYCCNLK